MTKIQLALVCVVVAGCGSSSTKLSRDARPSNDLAPNSDMVLSTPAAPADSRVQDVAPSRDGLPDEGQPVETRQDVAPTPPESAIDAPRVDVGTLSTEVEADSVARDGYSESHEAGTADQSLQEDTPVADANVEAGPRDAGAAVPPLVIDGALASFCSGDTPRMIVNGIESHPAVTVREICYSCCMSGAFVVTTETFSKPIYISWRLLGSPLHDSPIVTRDVSKLPTDYPLRVVAGCDPVFEAIACPQQGGTCATPGDIYESGFTGELQISGDMLGPWDTSICLHFKAPAGSPPSAIQSLDFYAAHLIISR